MKRSEKERAKILREARDRFRRCQDREATARKNFDQDLQFVEGDARNGYQWPDDIRTQRDSELAPCLTINKTKQHCLDVMNDARQSRVAIAIKPTGGEATFESAQTLEGIVRYIEYQSRAGSAYQHALSYAVRAGIGWCRVVTDYAGDDTFDQDIFIRRIPDPMTVYLDPDINEFDGSDARFAFVFTDMPRDEFDRLYPQYKDMRAPGGNTTLGEGGTWVTKDKVRVAEYFRCEPQKDRLIAFPDPLTGEPVVESESKIDKALLASVIDNPNTMVRNTVLTKVEHFMIVGDEIAEEKEWPGRYIPLARCIGEETVINGILDRKGLTRSLLDPQRIFNYNASAFVQYGALQTKTPWLASSEAIEGYEEVWQNANIQAPAVLPYNGITESGDAIAPPQRIQPPIGAPVFFEGMNQAAEQMRMVSGQYQADMGAPSNERSGAAITARQRQGDNATYHYLDHQSSMIGYIGRIIIDLIPKVYDTARVTKMKAENGEEQEVAIDPNAPQHFAREQVGEERYKMIFNPLMGKYGVQAEVGPAYATKRQEAFSAYTQILAQNKDLTALIGDIAMRFADFPGAEEAAQRLRRMVPPQALGEGDAPDVQALKGQVQQMQQLVDALTRKLTEKQTGHMLEGQQKKIDAAKVGLQAYDSETKRLAALKDALVTDPEGVMELVRKEIAEALRSPDAFMLADAAADGVGNMPPMEPPEMEGGGMQQMPPQASPDQIPLGAGA